MTPIHDNSPIGASAGVRKGMTPCTHVSINSQRCPLYGDPRMLISMCNEGCKAYEPSRVTLSCTYVSNQPFECALFTLYHECIGDKCKRYDKPIVPPMPICKHIPDVPYSHCKLFPTMVCLGHYREDCKGYEPLKEANVTPAICKFTNLSNPECPYHDQRTWCAGHTCDMYEPETPCVHKFRMMLSGDNRPWCAVDDKGCSDPDHCRERQVIVCAQSASNGRDNERVCLEDVGEPCTNPTECLKFEPCEVEGECAFHDPEWGFHDTAVEEYHKFCLEHKIVKACFEYEDGEAVDYIQISEKEFQLSRVGDCATNYTLP